MKPLYIFDLDGTLADITHRRHHVADGAHDWPGFYKACVRDTPNMPVITTLAMLAMENDVWIWSGRSDEVYGETLDWLDTHTPLARSRLEKILTMRTAGDYTPDDKLKKSWYDALKEHDRRRIVAVFDDRDRMVHMWRGLGVACFQVAPGDF